MSQDKISESKPGKGRRNLLLGMIAIFALGGGGFATTFLGAIHVPLGTAPAAPEHEVSPMPDVAFIPVDQLTISLGPKANARHLRFASQLEVSAGHADEVKALMPRILDVLNGFLRAVEVEMLEDPSTLSKLKAQMLRRIQVVTGDGRVTDLLISEFVLN